MQELFDQVLSHQGKNYKILNDTRTKKGDLVYYHAEPPSQLSGIYIQGDWDDMHGYALFDPFSISRQIYGTDATAMNTFKIVEDRDTPNENNKSVSDIIKELSEDIANQWRRITDDSVNSSDLPALEDVIQWALEDKLPELNKAKTISFVKWLNKSKYLAVSGSYHIYEGGRYRLIEMDELYDKCIAEEEEAND